MSKKGKTMDQSSDALQILGTMSDEDRVFIGRIMRGEADRDQIQRGLVHAAIRSLRTNPVPGLEYQRALADVQKLVAKINAIPQEIVGGGYKDTLAQFESECG